MSKRTYTDDLKEWNNNMYSPGYYIGGNMPMDVKYGGNKARAMTLVQSFLILFAGALLLLATDYKIAGYILVSVGIVISAAVIWRMRYKKS